MPDQPAPVEERTPDVSDELLDLAWRAELARRVPGASAELIEEYCDVEEHPSVKGQREELRPILAAVIPEIERRVRERLADQIAEESLTSAWDPGGMHRAAQIVRWEGR